MSFINLIFYNLFINIGVTKSYNIFRGGIHGFIKSWKL